MNVQLSGAVLTSDINNATSPNPVASYTYNNIKYTGNLPGGLDNLYQWVGAYNYNTLDEEITDLGYVKEHELSDYVQTVDGVGPDENGNVELSGYVKTVDGVEPDADGNVQLDLSGYVKTVDDIEPDENGNVELTGVVRSIEGQYGPDEVGDISFGLSPNKWVVTDALGCLSSTDDMPVVLSANAKGYVYADNGGVTYRDEQYVDLSTAQTANGQKTWNDNATFHGTVSISNPSGVGAITMANYNASTSIMARGNSMADIQLTTAGQGTAFQILKAGTATTLTDQIVRIDAEGQVEIDAGGGAQPGVIALRGNTIIMSADVNAVQLEYPPDNQAPPKAVATVGYVKDVALSGVVKTVNNIPPDQNGNVNVQASLSGAVLTSDINNAASPNPVASYTYNNIKYTGNLPGGLDNLYQWVGAYGYNTLDDEITDLGYVKDNDLGDLAYLDNVVVDGHTSDANGEVSFNLAASKWVKTDASGHLTTTNDTPVTVDTSRYTPVTTSTPIPCVTGVLWNGTKLYYKYRNLTFVNGVLVTLGNETTTDIDTAVTYNP